MHAEVIPGTLLKTVQRGGEPLDSANYRIHRPFATLTIPQTEADRRGLALAAIYRYFFSDDWGIRKDNPGSDSTISLASNARPICKPSPGG